LDVEFDTTGRLLPIFYDLFEKSLVRWAGQQNEPLWLARWRGRRRDSLHKFQTIAKMLGTACKVWVAWYQGQPAAASIVLQHHNVNDSRGVIDKELSPLTGANELLQKLTIEDACNAGCRYYHLGESGGSESLAYFKGRFGAIGYPYAEYHLERLPLTKWDGQMRGLVKQMIGFKDA
jgi:hypothetical protein